MINPPHKFLSDLARFVPAISQGQLLRAYFNNNLAAMTRAIRDAQAKGLISVSTQLVRARDTSSPIVVVRPGDKLPCPHQVAYLASLRWREFEPKITIRSTAKLCALSGGNPIAIAAGHLSHELALTDVFLSKRQANPDFEWELQTQKGSRGVRVDAVSVSGFVELVGRYSGNSVAAKMQIAGDITIELW